jgi:hypothetical protein
VKRILMVLALALIMASMMAVTASIGFADPNCTGPPSGRPHSCLVEPGGSNGGPPGPGNFVGPGGGSRTANHH